MFLILLINVRYWSDKGICWARNSRISDLDDTAMGFRLLRLHGCQVSPGKPFIRASLLYNGITTCQYLHFENKKLI